MVIGFRHVVQRAGLGAQRGDDGPLLCRRDGGGRGGGGTGGGGPAEAAPDATAGRLRRRTGPDPGPGPGTSRGSFASSCTWTGSVCASDRSAWARFSDVPSPTPNVTATAPNKIAASVTNVRAGRANGPASPSVTARGTAGTRPSSRCAR